MAKKEPERERRENEYRNKNMEERETKKKDGEYSNSKTNKYMQSIAREATIQTT